MDEVTREVRCRIFEYYLANCRPPTTQDIAESVGISEEQARVSFQQLDAAHHVVLHKPGVHTPTPICMAHPFSHLYSVQNDVQTNAADSIVDRPTPYVVAQVTRSWWTNCAWCGFGLAAMLLGPHGSSPSPCERYEFKYGEVMNLDTMWKLSKAWYENKASHNYDRFNAQEVTDLFQELRLVSEFWAR
ncbi:putative transmembrane protein [Colletotrichum asianum]